MSLSAPSAAVGNGDPVSSGALDAPAGGGDLSAETKRLVRDTFARLAPAGPLVADAFYRKLFELEPGLRPLLEGEARQHRETFMLAMNVVVATLNRMNELAPVLRLLAARYRAIGITAPHYGAAGEALLWTLQECLGGRFTAEAREAWTQVCTRIAEEMEGA